jgi:hypothetical protein
MKKSKTLKGGKITNNKTSLLDEIKQAVMEVTVIKQGGLRGVLTKDLFNEL